MIRISTIYKNLLSLTLSAPVFRVQNPVRYAFAETSRQIERQMREERAKQLTNKFRALQTSFGLHPPSSLTSDYPRPPTIQYTMESLRKCSHMYPEYLQKELNNSKSQFFETIEESFTGLEDVANKESIQFVEFMIVWKVYLHNMEFQEVLIRKIYQMELDLNQIMRVMTAASKIEQKTVRDQIIQNLQSKILKKVVNIEPHEYQSLFKLLNYLRMNDLSPKVTPQTAKRVDYQLQTSPQSPQSRQSFFKLVQTILLRSLPQIPLPALVSMVVHYANNINESQDVKLQILSKVQPKIIENISFFNHDELIAIMYSYIKTNTQSERLVQEFVRKVELLYFEIDWQNKKRILELSASLKPNKWIYLVSVAIFEVLKGKKVINRQGQTEVDPNSKEVEYQLLPSIYLSSLQTNLATPELIAKIQPTILENLFNYNSQDVALIAWLFTITPENLRPQLKKTADKDVLYSKLEAIIQGGFNSNSFTLKDISMVVWALCNVDGKAGIVYKEKANFWRNLQDYISDRIANQKQERLFNGCCQVMWAYANNKPLRPTTVNHILDLIIDLQTKNSLQEQMFIFQLTTMSSFFYSLQDALPKAINTYMETLSLKYFQQLCDTMNYVEILKMLKYIVYDHKTGHMKPEKLKEEVWDKILGQFERDINHIQYGTLMGVIGFVVASPQGRKRSSKAVRLVKLLMDRKKSLQQLKPTDDTPQSS